MWRFCEEYKKAVSHEGVGEWAMQASWRIEYGAEDG